MAVIAGQVPVFKRPVKIHFSWYEPNLKRDVGNVRVGEKFISDALVELGKIKNDSQRWVVGMSDEFHLDRINPRIEVEVTEAQGVVGMSDEFHLDRINPRIEVEVTEAQ